MPKNRSNHSMSALCGNKTAIMQTLTQLITITEWIKMCFYFEGHRQNGKKRQKNTPMIAKREKGIKEKCEIKAYI